MKQTVKLVRPSREFETRDGAKLVSVEVTFADGSDGSVIVNPKNADMARAAMEKLVNVEEEYDLEPKADYNGRKQWKIKGYPGKPGGGGFGGKQWKDNSPSIEAQNAVNNAVKLVTELHRLLPASSEMDVAMRYVEEYAPRMHALMQSLKTGPARPTTPDPTGDAKSSLPTPVGVAATWEEQEGRIASGGSVPEPGEGKADSPDTSGTGEVGTELRTSLPSSEPSPVPGPTEELEDLWEEALARDLTKARVVSILKKAGQPVTGWEDVDTRQLRSLLGVTR